MRTRAEVTAEKLRGGFYTPAPLVEHCLARAARLATGDRPLRVLEPSAGDGAFLRGLGADVALRGRVGTVTALEPQELEAAKARRALRAAGLSGAVRVRSAVAWAAATGARFDLAVGNPPFVRYQFVSRADRDAAGALGRRVGTTLAGVANLWIPVLIGALSRLVAGGAFAFVVPAECLTGVSAGAVRAWTLGHCEDVRFDHFPPGSFPGVLQEVGVLSGRRARARRSRGRLTLVAHDARGDATAGETTRHVAPASAASWTRYLLAPIALQALDAALAAPGVVALGDIARFEVAIVTGANEFFCASDATVAAHGLAPWARPLLPRIRHAPGLELTAADLDGARRTGARVHLLDFATDAPDPLMCPGPRGYLEAGAARGLPERYKCRIRTPWFRVPGVRRGALLLSKRSHGHPRLVLNQAGAFTTDTIYRGDMTGDVPAAALAATFHNALTLLTAELEGRSFGGGVLELVPSEIARLAVPVAPGAGRRLAALDRIARGESPDALVRATDALVAGAVRIDPELLQALDAARCSLRDRRLARNRSVLAAADRDPHMLAGWPTCASQSSATASPAAPSTRR